MTDRRVLWLTPDKPDNISVGRRRIADHLEERGIEVTLRGTTVGTVLRSLRERGEYDAILGTTRAGAIAGVLVKLVHGRPLVVDHVDPIRQFESTHPSWLAVLVRLLENAAFAAADRVLYVYGEERDRVARYARSAATTDLGVEFERFADPDPAVIEDARARLDDLDLEENVAIYVGGLEPIYHVEELLAAMTHLPDWSLVIVGDGSLRETVRAAADQRANVHYLGSIPHEVVPGFVHLADVGVCLVDDPHTLKVLEYGAAGVPTVQVEGQAEVRFGDRVEFCSLDPADIAAAIRRAADTDGERLRSFVEEYDWRTISEDYSETITTVK